MNDLLLFHEGIIIMDAPPSKLLPIGFEKRAALIPGCLSTRGRGSAPAADDCQCGDSPLQWRQQLIASLRRVEGGPDERGQPGCRRLLELRQ